MTDTLLPPTATELERKLSKACQIKLDVNVHFLWDPFLCPPKWLPFLAWQYSVDRWDENWSEQVKRHVIADSYFTHKIKGTLSAIKRAIQPFGYVIRINEWFNAGNEPGTFSLEIGVLNQGITEEDYNELTRIINDVKSYSRHITGLSIALVSKGSVNLKCTSIDGHILTVYPYAPKSIISTGHCHYFVSTYIIDTLEVQS